TSRVTMPPPDCSGFWRLRRRARPEEVVALVVDQDERREVFDFDLPDRLHAEVGKVDDLDLADILLGQDRGRPADRTQVETSVLAARFGHDRAVFPLGERDGRSAVRLEKG